MQEDPTKLKSGTISTSDWLKRSKENVAMGDKEYTAAERKFVADIQDYLAKLAAAPGIDLPQHKSTLEQILKLLQQRIASKADNPEAEAGEEQ